MERKILYIIDGEYRDIAGFLKSKGYSSSNIIDLKKYEKVITFEGQLRIGQTTRNVN